MSARDDYPPEVRGWETTYVLMCDEIDRLRAEMSKPVPQPNSQGMTPWESGYAARCAELREFLQHLGVELQPWQEKVVEKVIGDSMNTPSRDTKGRTSMSEFCECYTALSYPEIEEWRQKHIGHLHVVCGKYIIRKPDINHVTVTIGPLKPEGA